MRQRTDSETVCVYTWLPATSEQSPAMERISLRTISKTAALGGATIVAADTYAQASQGGYGPGMMGSSGGGWMGGYGGIWLPILIVVGIAAVVAWVVSQKKK